MTAGPRMKKVAARGQAGNGRKHAMTGQMLNLIFAGGILLCAMGACSRTEGNDQEEEWAPARRLMLETIRQRGVRDPAVLAAMDQVRRHRFIPEPYRDLANPYGDHPCRIGFDQTISQPYIVAYMTAKMAVRPGDKVLEIGTGSGYQAAVLAAMGAEVFSIEIIPQLADHARQALAAEGFTGVAVRTGDGYLGWPEEAPFDIILVTCAPERIPDPLKEQLAEGGRMIIPVGAGIQRLVVVRKEEGRLIKTDDLEVRFVPMTGAAGE